MSTRCNIKVVDGNDTMWFYRHSDGYPEGTMPILKVFMKWLKDGKIRDNISQSAGWLIMLGALEYGTVPKCENDAPTFEGGRGYAKIDTIEAPDDWKVGAIEPTSGQHSDIEWLYTINLVKKTLTKKAV